MLNILKSCYYNIYFYSQNEPGCFGDKLYIKDLTSDITGITIFTKYKEIDFGLDFNEKLDNVQFCEGIEIINFGWKFNNSLNTVKFPSTLKKIIFGRDFNQPLFNILLPDDFELIVFNQEYSKLTINSLPLNLKKLKINNVGEPINNLPFGLEELYVDSYKPHTLDKLPFGCILTTNNFI